MNDQAPRARAPRAVGVLGAGYIAEFHVKALQQIPGVELRAICDLSRARAEAIATEHGVPSVYTDLAEMLAKEQLDVVHLLAPPDAHERLAVAALEAGVDVFLEKPMCATEAEARRVRDRARQLGRVVGVSHNFLYFPIYERLFADLEAGTLGELDQLDIVWNKPLGQLLGGPYGGWMFSRPETILVEVGPHSFAHALHLLGGAPETLAVRASDRIELPNRRVFYRRWECDGARGKATVRLRFSFIDGYPEHYVHVRSTAPR